MRTRLATFSDCEWVSITSQTEKNPPMNYITTSYTINTTRINLIWETTQNIQVLVN